MHAWNYTASKIFYGQVAAVPSTKETADVPTGGGQREAFMAALRQHANTPERRKAIAEALGVTVHMVSRRLTGDWKSIEPAQVFAIERACELPPGSLSHHLGYVPVGASQVLAAIEADSALTPKDRRALQATYLSLASSAES